MTEASKSTVTVEQLRRAKFTNLLHLNLGGRDGHRYHYRCVEFPEFTVIKASLRRPSRVAYSYFVRDEELPTLAAVAAKLSALWPDRSARTLAEVDTAQPPAADAS